MKDFWKGRASNYKKLDWVNNDELLKSCVEECYVEKEKIDLLDIGTGSGKILKALDPTVANLHGIDISPDMTSDLSGLDIKICDIYNLNEETFSKKFDVITARMVFHHLPDIEGALDCIKLNLNKGGKFLLCEGVPPSPISDEFYKIMFTLKEDREVIDERKIIKHLHDLGFEKIISKSIFLKNCSLNNWLDNSGIPQENIDAVKLLHYNAPESVKRDYNMVVIGDDLFMTWKFILITALKG